MPDSLRPILARLIAILVAALATWLSQKFGVKLTDQDQQQLVELVIFMLVYALTHKGISSKTNPADAATTALAQQGKAEQRALK